VDVSSGIEDWERVEVTHTLDEESASVETTSGKEFIFAK
jgi:hypothetical protein